jgi:hypothetical protein
MPPAPTIPEPTTAPGPALPAAPASWWDRLLLLAQRWVLIVAGAQVAQRLPLPLLEEWLPIKHIVIAVVTVILMGKTLFDTLFYDRFVP